MIRTPKQALAFVRKHRIVTMTRCATRPSFVEAVVGGPVRGSWWGHSRGSHIYRLAESLLDSKEVLSLKLVDGKVTFLHESLWPALARVVTDREWRTSAGRGLSADAQELMRVVERRGSLRLDRSSMNGRKELESTLLVHNGSMHTEKGSHTTVLTSWRRIFDSDTLARARRLSLSRALSDLGLAYNLTLRT